MKADPFFWHYMTAAVGALLLAAITFVWRAGHNWRLAVRTVDSPSAGSAATDCRDMNDYVFNDEHDSI